MFLKLSFWLILTQLIKINCSPTNQVKFQNEENGLETKFDKSETLDVEKNLIDYLNWRFNRVSLILCLNLYLFLF